MKRFALLLVVLAMPMAAAAGEIVLTIEGEATPFTLTEQRADLVVDVDCSIVSGVPPEVRVELAVTEAPYWLTATPGPHQLAASPADCPGGRATLTSLLKMFKHPVDEEPLAGEDAPVVVRASVTNVQGATFESTATIVVEPALYGKMEIAPRALPDLVEPGEIVDVQHTIRNGWNAPAIVSWTPDADARILGIGEHTTRVPANGEAIASANASIPGDRGTTLRLAMQWVARVDAPGGAELGNGTSSLALFVSCDPCVEPPAAAAPGGPEKVPFPGIALVGAAILVALAARPSRQ